MGWVVSSRARCDAAPLSNHSWVSVSTDAGQPSHLQWKHRADHDMTSNGSNDLTSSHVTLTDFKFY